jgi:multidrug efflux pump subunit AcrA (membrane-fusion protein)
VNKLKLIYVALLSFSVCSCVRDGRLDKKEKHLPLVKTQALEYRAKLERYIYPAVLESKNVVAVESVAEGKIVKFNLRVGQLVHEGAELLAIKSSDPSYSFPFIVKAPMSGIISKIDVAPGDRVIPNEVLLTMIDTSKPRVEIYLTAAELGKIIPKQIGTLKIGDFSTEVRVASVSPSLDRESGTALCELEFTQTFSGERSLAPGMVGQVIFEMNEKKALIISEESVFYRDRDPHVIQIKSDQRAQYVKISILNKLSGEVEVSSTDLKPGISIVVKSSEFIIDGEQVELEQFQSVGDGA